MRANARFRPGHITLPFSSLSLFPISSQIPLSSSSPSSSSPHLPSPLPSSPLSPPPLHPWFASITTHSLLLSLLHRTKRQTHGQPACAQKQRHDVSATRLTSSLSRSALPAAGSGLASRYYYSDRVKVVCSPFLLLALTILSNLPIFFQRSPFRT